jgi:hypothetical protein
MASEISIPLISKNGSELQSRIDMILTRVPEPTQTDQIESGADEVIGSAGNALSQMKTAGTPAIDEVTSPGDTAMNLEKSGRPLLVKLTVFSSIMDGISEVYLIAMS